MKVVKVFGNLKSWMPPFYDTGIAGLLYCARFLDSFFGETVVDHSLVVAAAKELYQRGLEDVTSDGVLQWIGTDDVAYIGEGMGASGDMLVTQIFTLLPGVLRELMYVPEIMDDSDMFAHITTTIDMIVGRQVETGQVLETQCDFIPHPYVKVQWCHGAPGQVFFSQCSELQSRFLSSLWRQSY